ncbi:hypothetical protein CC80DRAFT_510782 [Byssothecium circinans]|uniref:Uncharacterized protein n=1 Tax=Byssothecium circinans TaxID=147558 RepID=A0A6A5T999_9PLEO|nr:hypothetical protein CC80DRAFT_510782 [Byssothecium circinans]
MSSSRSSYASSSYAQDKGASYNYAPRTSSSSSRSTSSSTYTSSSTTSSSSSASASSSLFAHSGQSSRNYRYASKPQRPVVHNGGGASNDPNTSTSAPNSGYYN